MKPDMNQLRQILTSVIFFSYFPPGPRKKEDAAGTLNKHGHRHRRHRETTPLSFFCSPASFGYNFLDSRINPRVPILYPNLGGPGSYSLPPVP